MIRPILVLVCLVVLAGPGRVLADSSTDDADDGAADWTGSETVRAERIHALKISVYSGVEYQGETNLDSPGDFEYWMVSGGANLSRKLTDKIGMAVKTDYRAVGYDFSGTLAGVNSVDPWNTVHVARVTPTLSFAFSPHWSVLVAPIFEFSGETGAAFSDAVRGGGALAFAYRREGFTSAIGVIALTEIEKDARLQPFVVFNWNVTDGFSVGLKADNSRGGELRFQYVLDRLTMAAGVGFRRELFRLNGDRGGLPGSGLRRDGVGEEEATVAKLTLGFRLSDTVSIEGYGGVTVDGQFRLEDEDGRRLASSDYDDSGFGGVNLRLHF